MRGRLDVREFLGKLEGVRRSGDGWVAKCPVRGHGNGNGDQRPSLSVSQAADGRILAKCHAGCPTERVIEVMGFSMVDLFPESPNGNGHAEIAATYDYEDETGNLLFQVVRQSPKKFFQRRPDGKGGWINKVGNTRKVLFRLREILAGDPTLPVFVVEGEKDVLELERLGLIATTNPMGAGKWRPEYSKSLRARDIVLIPDNDRPGRDHVETAARSLRDAAASVKILELPGLPKAGDVSGWLKAGGTAEELLRMTAEAPEWTPPHRPDLPDIVVTAKSLHDITAESLQALYARNNPPRLFRRAASLCRIHKDEKGRPFISDLDEYALRGEMDRAANFLKVGKGEELVPVAPPMSVVKDVLSRPDWEFPGLEAVIQAPALRPDGSCVDQPGYDPATRVYYSPAADLRIPSIPTFPSRAEIEKAVGLVNDAIEGFPFVDQASQTHTLALMLTPLVRPAIAGPVPLTIITAPQKGTGKTLLAEIAAKIAVDKAEHMGAPKREEEWQKLITSALIEGATFIILDNLRDRIRSAALERALTAGDWADRILGHSRMARVSQRATWVATANNAELGGDLSRRCYCIHLDAEMARPWQGREFRHPDLLAWVKQNRGDLVAALLTLARGWFAAGCPRAETPVLGKFEDWCHVVGGILARAGIDGFLGNLDSMYEEMDEEYAQWESFFRAWYDIYGDAPRAVSQLVDAMFPEGGGESEAKSLRECLPEDLVDIYGSGDDRRGRTSFAKRLGNALNRRKNVRYGDDGLHLRKAEKDTHRKANTWQVVTKGGSADSAGLFSTDGERKIEPSGLLDPDLGCTKTNPPNPQTRSLDSYDLEERAALQEDGEEIP